MSEIKITNRYELKGNFRSEKAVDLAFKKDTPEPDIWEWCIVDFTVTDKIVNVSCGFTTSTSPSNGTLYNTHRIEMEIYDSFAIRELMDHCAEYGMLQTKMKSIINYAFYCKGIHSLLTDDRFTS